MTVQQLKDLLAAAQKSQKSDAEVAAQLKDVELTEGLTHSVRDGLKPIVPGQLTTEQLFVLEIRSAVQPPPARDIPSTRAPDAAKQKAILDKAMEYAKTDADRPLETHHFDHEFHAQPGARLGRVNNRRLKGDGFLGHA